MVDLESANAMESAQTPPKKKLLALHGGGIRGVITLEMLAQLEAELRLHLENQYLVLGDYFDYIAGTSTGGVIAAGLAKGMEVSELLNMYVVHGEEMFDRAASGSGSTTSSKARRSPTCCSGSTAQTQPLVTYPIGVCSC